LGKKLNAGRFFLITVRRIDQVGAGESLCVRQRLRGSMSHAFAYFNRQRQALPRWRGHSLRIFVSNVNDNAIRYSLARQSRKKPLRLRCGRLDSSLHVSSLHVSSLHVLAVRRYHVGFGLICTPFSAKFMIEPIGVNLWQIYGNSL
jgi:hypothetical protein